MKNLTQEFPDLRAVFCARYRCGEAQFVRKAFFKALPWHAWLLWPFLGGFCHRRYQHDVEAIRTIGEARSVDDLNRALDELYSLHEMERDWVKRLLGLKVDSGRLMRLFEPLVGQVAVSREALAGAVGGSDTTTALRREVTGTRSGEVAAQRLRRAMRIHGAVTGGRQMDDILAGEQITHRELEELLEEFAKLRSELGWLKGYLREREELERMRHGVTQDQRKWVA